MATEAEVKGSPTVKVEGSPTVKVEGSPTVKVRSMEAEGALEARDGTLVEARVGTMGVVEVEELVEGIAMAGAVRHVERMGGARATVEEGFVEDVVVAGEGVVATVEDGVGVASGVVATEEATDINLTKSYKDYISDTLGHPPSDCS